LTSSKLTRRSLECIGVFFKSSLPAGIMMRTLHYERRLARLRRSNKPQLHNKKEGYSGWHFRVQI
jgi:hypothetical protein